MVAVLPLSRAKLHTTDWQRDPLHTLENKHFPIPGMLFSTAVLARYAAAVEHRTQ